MPPAGMDSADYGGGVNGMINHAFEIHNRSNDNDKLVKGYIPPTVAGLVGFDLGLRTYDKGNVAIEIVVEVVDVPGNRVNVDQAAQARRHDVDQAAKRTSPRRWARCAKRSSGHRRVLLARPVNHEHRNLRGADHIFRDAAEQCARESAPSVRADDDEVGFDLWATALISSHATPSRRMPVIGMSDSFCDSMIASSRPCAAVEICAATSAAVMYAPSAGKP